MSPIKTLAAASTVALLSAPAFAGSYTAPAPEPVVPAPAPVMMSSDWTGAYAGASLGWGSLEVNNFDDDGMAYGFHAGYDYDFGTFVLGGEAEYMARDLWDNGAADSTRLKARLGYDAGPALIYGVLGGTMIDSQWGYNVGVGGEYMMTDTVSVGAEYIYDEVSDFDDGPNTLSGSTLAARVNYRF